jgi:DNA-binding transcriptional ArsR family regulator
VSPATVSWHVSRLVENGIVSEVRDGRTTYYTVTDEELTLQLLVRYQESFVDRAVGNVLDLWGWPTTPERSIRAESGGGCQRARPHTHSLYAARLLKLLTDRGFHQGQIPSL